MTSLTSMTSRRKGRRSDRRDGAKGTVRCLPLPHLRGQTAEVPHGDHLRRGVQPVSPQGAQPPHEPPPLPTASPAPPTRRVRRPRVAPPRGHRRGARKYLSKYIISSLLGSNTNHLYLEEGNKMCMSGRIRLAGGVDKMYPRFDAGLEVNTHEETTAISRGSQQDEEVVRRRTPNQRPDAEVQRPP